MKRLRLGQNEMAEPVRQSCVFAVAKVDAMRKNQSARSGACLGLNVSVVGAILE